MTLETYFFSNNLSFEISSKTVYRSTKITSLVNLKGWQPFYRTRSVYKGVTVRVWIQ